MEVTRQTDRDMQNDKQTDREREKLDFQITIRVKNPNKPEIITTIISVKNILTVWSLPVNQGGFHSLSFREKQIWYDASRETRLNLPNNDFTDLGGQPKDFKQKGT